MYQTCVNSYNEAFELNYNKLVGKPVELSFNKHSIYKLLNVFLTVVLDNNQKIQKTIHLMINGEMPFMGVHVYANKVKQLIIPFGDEMKHCFYSLPDGRTGYGEYMDGQQVKIEEIKLE